MKDLHQWDESRRLATPPPIWGDDMYARLAYRDESTHGGHRVTPKDLKAWRERLGLTQPEAAELLGIGHRTYQRHEEGGLFATEEEVPRCLAAARYGADAAVRTAESVLEVGDFTGKATGKRWWNRRLSAEEARFYTLFAVARHLLEHRPLLRKEMLHFHGLGVWVTVPQNYVAEDNHTIVQRPERARRPDPYGNTPCRFPVQSAHSG
jgi:DNA-binding XRE family transcriptional regulator